MTIQIINTGSSANSGDGDSIRTAFAKVNQNFAYLSTATFGGNTVDNSSLNFGSVDEPNTNFNVILAQATNFDFNNPGLIWTEPDVG